MRASGIIRVPALSMPSRKSEACKLASRCTLRVLHAPTILTAETQVVAVPTLCRRMSKAEGSAAGAESWILAKDTPEHGTQGKKPRQRKSLHRWSLMATPTSGDSLDL